MVMGHSGVSGALILGAMAVHICKTVAIFYVLMPNPSRNIVLWIRSQ
jgi:hypothetical protein